MSVSSAAIEELLGLGAVALAAKIRAGDLSAVEAVEAYIARIEQVDPRLNAVILRRFDDARHEANQLDTRRLRGEEIGPLGGVPITVKECFHFPGMPSSIGVESLARQEIRQEYLLVSRLRAAGAVVLGKTNLPQLMVMHESDNPVYGRTNNPWNMARVPGGSSGGEAAIVAAGGSALGLGNDLGGSIRVPSHFCGICGVKPTSSRLTNLGGVANFRGMEAFLPQSGPLGRRVADLELALAIMAQPGQQQIDPSIPPVPWSDSQRVDVGKLRIGWFDDDGFFAAAPAVRRAVREAVELARAAGAEIVRFPVNEATDAVRLFFSLVSADGGADCLRLLGRSRRDPQIRKLLSLAAVPGWLRGAIAAGADALGQPRTGFLLRHTKAASANRYWQAVWELRGFCERFHARLLAERIDALICPPHALPALRHGTASDLGMAASYSMLFNVMGMPAGVLPVTRVRNGEESDRPPSRDRVEGVARACEAQSAGLPVGVQIVARPWREDVVLAVMRVLETGLLDRDDYPARRPVQPGAAIERVR